MDTPNLLWSHNDTEGQPFLYGFDTLGNLLRSITVSNATNINWKNLAKDAAGNIYVGDFGNNGNSRKDLRIYKIPDPASFAGTSVASPFACKSFFSNRGTLSESCFRLPGDSIYTSTTNKKCRTGLVLYTLQGKEVMWQTINPAKQTTEVRVAHLQAGIYLGQLVSNKGISFACRVVIAR